MARQTGGDGEKVRQRRRKERRKEGEEKLVSERRAAQDAQPERRSPENQTAGVRRATRLT